MNSHQAQMRIGAQLGLAALALEWNALATAEQATTDTIAIGQQIAYEDFWMRDSMMLVRIQEARGAMAAAWQLLQVPFTQTPHRQALPILREVRLWQAPSLAKRW